MAGKPHVLIAGAGVGGLTAALALLKRGFDVDVYEQAPEIMEVGAGFQIKDFGRWPAVVQPEKSRISQGVFFRMFVRTDSRRSAS